MNKIKIPGFLKSMYCIFQANGYQAFLVGGAVRDMFMGKQAADFDIATNATPQQICSIFKKVIPTGIAHGTVTVIYAGKSIEVTTFRTESDYSDGRHPGKVNYADTIEEDLSRRDFTMNAIALSLEDEKVKDPFNGIKDIKSKIIKSVGNPFERFSEDGLRPIRAIRFSSQLGFDIEKNTYQAISDEKILAVTKKISIERFRDEFTKIIKSKEPSVGLKKLEETGLLEIFIPEMTACRNCIQKDERGFHNFDVMDHLFYSTDGSPREKINVRLAALFHDIGKPKAKKTISGQNGEIYTFYNHEKYSSKMTAQIMTKLKFPNALTENVCHLIENHMFHYENCWTDSAVRRFLVRVKPENFEDLIDLRLADIYGMNKIPVRFHDSIAGKNLLELSERIEKIKEQNDVLDLKSLKINGNDLIAAGIPSGKQLGEILNNLFETVLDDPAQNEKEKLIKIALNLWRKIK